MEPAAKHHFEPGAGVPAAGLALLLAEFAGTCVGCSSILCDRSMHNSAFQCISALRSAQLEDSGQSMCRIQNVRHHATYACWLQSSACVACRVSPQVIRLFSLTVASCCVCLQLEQLHGLVARQAELEAQLRTRPRQQQSHPPLFVGQRPSAPRSQGPPTSAAPWWLSTMPWAGFHTTPATWPGGGATENASLDNSLSQAGPLIAPMAPGAQVESVRISHPLYGPEWI